MQLPDQFLNRMKLLLGPQEYQQYLSAMELSPMRSLRVNTLKVSEDTFLQIAGTSLEPCFGGYYFPDSFPVGLNPLHAAGLFYVQEPSARFPATLLKAKPHETILDLCAAPGGKTGQLAADMENTGLLIANEINDKRAQVLASNLERLGVRNALILNMRPDLLCPLLKSCCDAVLVDAPCSGEGMFRKDEGAVLDWSEEHVNACAERQSAILDSAAETVKAGGRLVYSTCTFSKEENEDVISSFLLRHPDFTLVSMHRLYPHTSDGEGQFAALLNRMSAPDESTERILHTGIKAGPVLDFMKVAPKGAYKTLKDGRICLYPEKMPAEMDRMRILRCGVCIGEEKNNRFIPSHSLFMAFGMDSFQSTYTLDDATVKLYLSGEEIACDPSLKGYTAVLYKTYTLGFGKASSGRLKNHLPKGLRLHEKTCK